MQLQFRVNSMGPSPSNRKGICVKYHLWVLTVGIFSAVTVRKPFNSFPCVKSKEANGQSESPTHSGLDSGVRLDMSSDVGTRERERQGGKREKTSERWTGPQGEQIFASSYCTCYSMFSLREKWRTFMTHKLVKTPIAQACLACFVGWLCIQISTC